LRFIEGFRGLKKHNAPSVRGKKGSCGEEFKIKVAFWEGENKEKSLATSRIVRRLKYKLKLLRVWGFGDLNKL